MNPLLEKFEEYKSIVNYRFVYQFANGLSIEYKLRQADFPHLLGLHKLTDIPIIQQFRDVNQPNISARYILSRIKKEELLTDAIVRSSLEFPTISDRYENFTRDNLLTVSYTDVIIDFNPTLIGSSLQAKYILFEDKHPGYNHLCIGCTTKGNYAESFFYQPSDRYIVNQNTCAVEMVQIYDTNGRLFFEDGF